MSEFAYSQPRLRSEFQRAFVAMRYFLGARRELGAPLGEHAGHTLSLLAKLEHSDKQRRAETLAAEIGLVARALEARAYR